MEISSNQEITKPSARSAMSRLIVENGIGTADVGDYQLKMEIEEVDDECYSINLELLSIEDTWYAKASLNPDSIHDLIEALTLIANHFQLERPKTSLFEYTGEPGSC